jgi:hypothetical protein
MNECIDSTMGRIPHMLAVLLVRDDPRTSWSFQCANVSSVGKTLIPVMTLGSNVNSLLLLRFKHMSGF